MKCKPKDRNCLSKTSGKAQLLVQEMVQGTEVLIGARTDPQYGPFLMVGLGGIFVEVLKDVSIRLLPVDEKEARAMLKELRGYKVLEGVRGQGPRDVDALVKAMVGLSEIFAAHQKFICPTWRSTRSWCARKAAAWRRWMCGWCGSRNQESSASRERTTKDAVERIGLLQERRFRSVSCARTGMSALRSIRRSHLRRLRYFSFFKNPSSSMALIRLGSTIEAASYFKTSGRVRPISFKNRFHAFQGRIGQVGNRAFHIRIGGVESGKIGLGVFF